MKTSKRKAWVFEEAPVLNVSDLFAGREARQRFFSHLRNETPRDIKDILMYFGFKLLPTRAVSEIGGWIGRRTIIGRKISMSARARANLRLMRPEATDAEIEALYLEFADNQGRQRLEYSVMRRLGTNTRNIRFVGTEKLVETCKDQPVIFIGMHTANWEIAWQLLLSMGLDLAGSYEPPKRYMHHWLLNRERKRTRLEILKPGKDAVRPALQTLKDNGNLIVFCDEGFDGVARAPFLGRKPHLHGNYAFVARLARKTNALLYPVHMTREGGVNFTFHALEPFRLPEENTPGSNLIADVELINSVVEPVIKAHAGQWFFLSDTVSPI